MANGSHVISPWFCIVLIDEAIGEVVCATDGQVHNKEEFFIEGSHDGSTRPGVCLSRRCEATS